MRYNRESRTQLRDEKEPVLKSDKVEASIERTVRNKVSPHESFIEAVSQAVRAPRRFLSKRLEKLIDAETKSA